MKAPTPTVEQTRQYWLSASDYPAAQQLCPDLPATFAEWSDLAEAKVRRREAAGDVATRVAINPHLYAAWCRANKLACGTETLMSYAIAEARRRATRF